MASSENKYSSFQNNWADLPIELLTDILDKVTMLQDYIRFGAVCKSWYFVTGEQKQKRQRQLKGPPLLHVPVVDNPNEWALYSVPEGKVYNYRFSIPYKKKWCGASHGCLAIPDQDSITKDLYITLFNPFSGGTIQLPPHRNNLEFNRRIREYEADFNILNEYQIHKIILSCDPFLYPDDYVVAVIYGVNRNLVWLKSGQRKWNLGVSNWRNSPNFFLVMGFSDILFLGGLLYGIILYRENYLYFIDEFDDLSDKKVENKHFKHFTLCKMGIKSLDIDYPRRIFKSYIVESSNGSMLFIRRIFRVDKIKDRLKTIDFKIYKLTDLDNERGKWIEIKNLEKGDVLFLGPNNSVCISASSVPNCKFNSIYYTDESTAHPYPYYCELGSHEATDMGVFHLEDRRWETNFVLHPSFKFMSPAAWISPTLN